MSSEERNQRIDDALSSLVESLIPAIAEEDDDAADARHDAALDRARAIVASHRQPSIVADVQHVSDLIKKKLIREHTTPDLAVRFTTLYTRLLSQPVLSQKWAILYLLHQLADAPGAAEPPKQTFPTPAGDEAARGDGAFSDAFSYAGLHRLPGRDATRGPGGGGLVGGDLGAQWEGVGNRAEETGMKTKVEVLAERGDVVGGNIEPSEQTLLSSLPFTLLGLSSTSLPFNPPTGPLTTPVTTTPPAPKYAITIPPSLPLPLCSLLHTLAEPSLLYRSLNEFVQSSVESDNACGLVEQSLKSAIGLELRGYINLVGGLESEIRRALASTEGTAGTRLAGVTLKRCVVWTREATMGLRLMSLIVEEARNKKGGQLISTIHSFASSHGDPFVHAFAERLLSHVTRPFYDMLRHWIYDGELTDPYLEFFVTEQHVPDASGGVSNSKVGASSVWEDKYTLHTPQVPSIITESFAKKVFLIGKSLNFIRHGCSDSEWVESYSKSTSKELTYGDTARLEMSIDEAYKTTMARLIELMGTKFKLFDHLLALKKFLLLGQGDFIALLMEGLSDSLERPANTLYRHNLTAQLEHAIRGSNAQFESPDVLRRLDARMLELSHGEIGWDVFTLEYKIDAPVDVVVTPYGSRQYLKVFNFLWRVKRVEFALGQCWRRFMTGARGVLRAVEDLVGTEWKRARCVIAEMVHFVNQLQYYILFEVIESSWTTLQTAIGRKDATLDDLIEAHAKYLQHITHKGLLGSTSTRGKKGRAGAQMEGDDTFMTQLHEILKIMLAYKDAVDGLYGYSVAEFTRRQERETRIEKRTQRGEWGITEKDDEFAASGGRWSGGEADLMLPTLRGRLRGLSADFRARVVILLGDLAYQPDMDMRLLGVLLSFNEYVSPV
ncbi:Microtubule-nucleating Tub4p (gamma-tubulin) complex component [Rhizina undulata]